MKRCFPQPWRFAGGNNPENNLAREELWMLPGNFDEWVSHLTPQEPPVLQATLLELGKLRDKPDVSAAQIAAIVLPDPMMTLKLMRLANANKAGAFAQRIATAEHAVMMLGLEPIFNRLGATPTLEDSLPPAVQQGLQRTAARAYHAATQAREWAVQRLDTSVEEVYIAALLQELGEMVLWAAAPDQLVTVDKARRKNAGVAAEQEVFGFTIDQLSVALAEQWNMPPLVTTAMQPAQCEAHVRPRCVMLASRLASNAEWGWHGAALSSDFDAIAETRRLHCDDVVAQVHRTAADAARRRVFGSAHPAATWLPMLPGDWPPDQQNQQAQTDAAQVSQPAAEESDPFQSVMDEIAHHLDGTLTLHELLVLVMRGMRRGVGLERVVFALLTQDRSALAAKSVVGAEEGAPLKGFRFNMADKHLFSVLMSKPQAIHITSENRAKYAGYLSEDIVRTTSGRDFCAMSFALNGKVIGMFYGDGGAVDLEHYEKFKKLCTQAALGMAHLAKAKA